MGDWGSKTKRVLELVAAMKRGEYPNAGYFGRDFCAKTLHRDVAFLKRRHHAPVDYDPARHGYYLWDATWSLPLLAKCCPSGSVLKAQPYTTSPSQRLCCSVSRGSPLAVAHILTFQSKEAETMRSPGQRVGVYSRAG